MSTFSLLSTPLVSLTEAQSDPDACHICGKSEQYDRPIRECDNCELMVCSDCAESDYDQQGEPGDTYYVNTQWVCNVPCEEVAI